MDKKKRMIFIDSNVFIVELRYKNDANYSINRSFLHSAAKTGRAVTSIINLLEVCGILSFNLNSRQLQELFHYLPVKFGIEVIPSHDLGARFPAPAIKDLMEIMKKKASLGDALVSQVVNEALPERALFVSWDAPHFEELLNVEALTPREFMSKQR